MRITFALIVVNTVMVQLINPNFAVRMNNLLIFQHNAHVNNAAFVVVEKSQIAGNDSGNSIGFKRRTYGGAGAAIDAAGAPVGKNLDQLIGLQGK